MNPTAKSRTSRLVLALIASACALEERRPWERPWKVVPAAQRRCFAIANDSTTVLGPWWTAPPTRLILDTAVATSPVLPSMKHGVAKLALVPGDTAYPGGWWAGDVASDSLGVWFAIPQQMETIGLIGRIGPDGVLRGRYTGERDQAPPPVGQFTGQSIQCDDT